MPHVKNPKTGRIVHYYRFDATPEQHEILQRIRSKHGGGNQELFRRLFDYLAAANDTENFEVTLAADYVVATALDRWHMVPDYLQPSEADKMRLGIVIKGLLEMNSFKQLYGVPKVEEPQLHQ